MRPLAKVGLVAGGYVAALAIALLVVQIRIAATSGQDRQDYGAMYAFGDSLLFLAVFGMAAVPATGTWLFFLRSRPAFWSRLAVTALFVASTGLAAALAWFLTRSVVAPGPLASWSIAAVLRILVAPLLAGFFVLSALLAPNRPARTRLLAAATVETAAFAGVAFAWFASTR